MKFEILITAGVAFALLLSSPNLAAEEEPDAQAAKQDLETLQGKWEVTLRAGGESIRNVQTIRGTKSTVDRFNEDGVLLHSHTAEFNVRIDGQARIFTFFDLRVTAGPQAGKGFKGPLSFVYVVDQEVFTEARGLLKSQRDGPPRLLVWERVVENKVSMIRK